MRRVLVLFALVSLTWVVAVPASASVTGGCRGSATIQGVTYTPGNDTPSNPVRLPAELDVPIDYKGSVPFENKGHSGWIGVDIANFTVRVFEWSHPNQGNDQEAEGTVSTTDVYEALPFDIVGLYRVSGAHAASGGSCTGFAYVLIEGNPLATPIGSVAVIGALVMLLDLLVLGRVPASKPGLRITLGALSGLLLGAFGALVLQQFGVWPLDVLSVYGLPALGLILGIIWTKLAPFAPKPAP